MIDDVDGAEEGEVDEEVETIGRWPVLALIVLMARLV